MILHSMSRDPLMGSTCYFLDALRPNLHKIMGMTLLNNRVSSRFACYIAIELPFI